MSATSYRTRARVYSLVAAACLASLTAGDVAKARLPLLSAVKLERDGDEPAREDEPGKAQEFFARKRAPFGETAVPTERYAVARKQMARMRTYSTASSAFARRVGNTGISPSLPNIGTWSSLGPGNVGGRTRAILIDPTPPGNTYYAAGVAGGVWKSTNAGASWTAMGDAMANLAVSSLAMNPAAPAEILAGTGEGYYNLDAARGAGIFKTTNAGATWTQLAATNNANFYYVNDVVWSPNTGYVYAATQTGIWRSTNGGTSWASILNTSIPSPGLLGGCLDLALRTDVATDWLIAACGTFTTSALYVTEDAHAAFPSFGTFFEAAMGRTSLAIAPSNQNIVYALAADNTDTSVLYAVFRSADGGHNWAKTASQASAEVDTLLLTNPVYAECLGQELGQGWYDNVIAVDPADPTGNTVWAGGIDLFRSTNGGVNWRPASSWWEGGLPYYLHSDQHAIVFHPTTGTMLIGNDGGIFQTTNRSAAPGQLPGCQGVGSSIGFQPLNNGYGVTQFYYGAVFPNETSYFGGTQDNGTVRGNDGGPNAWTQLLGGDGGAVAVDPDHPNVVFAENYGLSIKKSTDGGAHFAAATSGISGDVGFAFIAPFVMDPTAPQRLWTGGYYAWRTDNQGASWTRASSVLSSGVTAIAVSPVDGNYVLMGTEHGVVHHTVTGLSTGPATAWTAGTVRSGYISSLAFDNTSPAVAYATISSFGGFHVWKSSTGGATWNQIDGTGVNKIPDIPVHSIVVDPINPLRLYVGTDLGVFVTIDGGLNWGKENTGFTNAVTESLVIKGFNLYAFTHGRGAWRVPLLPGSGPSTIVQIAAPESSVGEGSGAAHVPVKVITTNHQPTGDVATVAYATSDGTATAGLDYTSTAGVLTIPAGTPDGSLFSVDVPILEDEDGEVPETFDVTLSAPVGAVLSLAQHRVTIVDNDGAALSIADMTVTEGNSGVANALFTVTLVPTVTDTVTVSYAAADGSAVHGTDFSPVTGVLTFTPGTATRTIAVPIIGDTFAEPTESFTVSLSAPVNAAIKRGTAVGTILDNDICGTVQFSASTYTVSEAGIRATVTVSRTGGAASGVTVQYRTTDGTATAPADYTASTGTLSFGAGTAAQTFYVNVVNDTVDENDETVFLELFDPVCPGVTLGDRFQAQLTITDNDAGGAFVLGAPTYSGLEGTSVNVIVKRTGGVASGATVHFELSDATASAGDYTPLSTDLTFAANEVQKTIPVALAHDTIVEGNETVNVTLSNPGGGATLGAPAAAVLTILDASPKLAFAAAVVNVNEAAASVVLTVNRTGPVTDVATVDYATVDGTATAGLDYTMTAGTLTFPAQVRTKTISVPLKPDTIVEGPEEFTVTLSNAGNALLGAITTATVKIADNDLGGVFKFAATAYTVNEPLTGILPGKVTVTVTRTGGVASGVTVNYAATGGTATSGADYNPISGTLSFGAGVTSKTFVVEVLPDDAFEGYETIALALDAPTGGASIGPQASATVTIVDSEPVVQFSAAAYKVGEGTAKAVITLKRTGVLVGPISVKVGVLGGTATLGADFLAPADTIAMPSGVALKTFTVDIVNDADLEPDETVVLGLADPIGASLGPQATATLTIVDNEPVVQFSAAAYTVNEAGPKATITLKRTGSVLGAATVNVAVTGGSATAGADFTPPVMPVTFTSGLAAKTFTIDIANDHDGEPNETVELAITGATGAFVGPQSTAVLTIVDNEPALQWSAATYLASEPANTTANPVTLTVAIKRVGLLTFPSTVDYTIADGTATAESDYHVAAMTGTIGFAAGQAVQTITILVLPDANHEGDETINLSLGNVTGGKLGTVPTAVVTIRDND
jgi:hypothetical protein